MADTFVATCDERFQQTGCMLYVSCFRLFSSYQQQEVVAALVTHVGSGVEVRVNAAFEVLSELVRSDAKSLSPFAVFIKSMLDFLDNLSARQIQSLFNILNGIAMNVCYLLLVALGLSNSCVVSGCY